MRKIEIKELRKILLELMDEIHAFCEKHGLKYYLSGGTLIGAIRHKGFIPWDDDIDIHMPRPDYEKFLELFPKESENVLLENRLNDKYRYTYAKVCKKNTLVVEHAMDGGVDEGVFIDVFPLDALGNTEEEAKKLMDKLSLKVDMTRSLIYRQWRKGVPFTRNFAIWGLHVVSLMAGGHKKLIKDINKIMTTYDYDKSKYVGEFIDKVQYKRITEKSLYGNGVLHEFEGRQYYVPDDYDKVLRNFYGDYMKLPPKEQQVLTHGFDAYVLED